MIHSGFGYDTHWLCGPGGLFPGPFGWIITLFFWGLLIFFTVKFIQFLFTKSSGNTRLDQLKERYAKGEISEDEYHRMKTEIN